MNKKLWIAIIIVVFIGVLIGLKQAGVIGSEEGVRVEVGDVEIRTIVDKRSASGKIQPEVEVKISPEVSGEIIALPVVEGQHVEAGDLLVSINPDLYRAAVNRAEASVNSARSALAQAKAQYIEAEKSFTRNKNLFDENVISQAEWDAAQRAHEVSRLAVESAEFQLQSAQATYKEAQDNLKRTTIVAPVSGTISALNVELGERVVGTAQMAGTELMRIANLSDMEVLVEVNENDIVNVSLNDTAVIEVDAYLDEKFKGVVTEIANSAKLVGTSADQVTNFEVKVRIIRDSYRHMNSEQPFRPGMTASVDILTDRQENVISVPIEAVTIREDTVKLSIRERLEKEKDDEDPFEVVFVPEGNKTRLVVVRTGIQDETHIQIIEGLSEGQSVIIGPYEAVSKDLNPGEVIRVDTSRKKDDKES